MAAFSNGLKRLVKLLLVVVLLVGLVFWARRVARRVGVEIDQLPSVTDLLPIEADEASPTQIRGLRLAQRIRDSRIGKAKQDLKTAAQQFVDSLVHFEGDVSRHFSEMADWRAALPGRHVANDYESHPSPVAVDYHWERVRKSRHHYLLAKARFKLESKFALESYQRDVAGLEATDADVGQESLSRLLDSERELLAKADQHSGRVKKLLEGLTQSLYPRLKATDVDLLQADDVVPRFAEPQGSVGAMANTAAARETRLMVIEAGLAKLDVIASGLEFMDAFWAFQKAVQLRRVRWKKYEDEFPHGFRGNVDAVHPEPPELDYITHIHTMRQAKEAYREAAIVFEHQQTLLRNEYRRRSQRIALSAIDPQTGNGSQLERSLQIANELEASFDERVNAIFKGAGS